MMLDRYEEVLWCAWMMSVRISRPRETLVMSRIWRKRRIDQMLAFGVNTKSMRFGRRPDCPAILPVGALIANIPDSSGQMTASSTEQMVEISLKQGIRRIPNTSNQAAPLQVCQVSFWYFSRLRSIELGRSSTARRPMVTWFERLAQGSRLPIRRASECDGRPRLHLPCATEEWQKSHHRRI